VIPNPVALASLGGVLAAVSIPLALRLVPRNRFYGVRIREAFESEERWYEINALGGRALLVYGILLVAFALATWDAAPSPRSAWSVAYVVGPLVPLVFVLSWVVARARRRS
jgi:hypothetical protein